MSSSPSTSIRPTFPACAGLHVPIEDCAHADGTRRPTMAIATPGLRLGTTLFSLTNEFHSLEYTFDELIAKVGALGLGPGLEVIGFQSIRGFPEVSEKFADRFKELLAEHGL